MSSQENFESVDRADAITFVCCIEHGRLERQTRLMIETFRANGGLLADSPILAVVGRRGSPLSERTLSFLKDNGVRLLRLAKANPVPWFNYSNKIVAVHAANALAKTPTVAWLDSDILIAAEPRGLVLAENEDFAGRIEYLPPAMVGDDQTHVPYWQGLCELLGADFESIPTLSCEHTGRVQRMYLNSGAFSWRRSSSFADAYRQAFITLMKSRLAQFDGHFFTADQVILTPVIVANQLRWRHLRYTEHHMTFPSQIDGPGKSPPMTHSSLIHYSRSLAPSTRERFMARLVAECPGVVEFIQTSETEPLESPLLARSVAQALRLVRGAQWRLYAQRVVRAQCGALALP